MQIDETSKISENYCSIYFRTKKPPKPYDKVFVCGSSPELGSWDVSKAISMELSSKVPCVYTCSPIKMKLGEPIDYKYLYKYKNNFVWEEQESNRILVPTGFTMIVENDQGVGRDYNLPPKISDYKLSNNKTVNSLSEDYTRKTFNDILEEIKILENHKKIDNKFQLYIISCMLPLKVIRSPSGEFACIEQYHPVISQLYELKKKIPLRTYFVGWCGYSPLNENEARDITELLEPLNCMPVFIPLKHLGPFFKFTKDYLYYLFHNYLMQDAQRVQNFFCQEDWQHFQVVNRIFADAAVRQANEYDYFWVHDYQLFLVPQSITRRIHSATIAYHLHALFPCYDVFRCSAICEEILHGMLFADLICFHTFNNARHFMVSCKRKLNIEHCIHRGGVLSLDYGGRSVMLRTSHIQVQYEKIRNIIENDESVVESIENFKKFYDSKFVFCSVDSKETLAGINLKLEAYEKFLRCNEEARSNCVLIQYFTNNYLQNDVSSAHQVQIDCLVDKLQNDYSEKVIVLRNSNFSPKEKFALFAISDCYINTNVSGGFNIDPLEFICCKGDNPACQIISDTYKFARQLKSVITVNPWKTDELAELFNLAYLEKKENILPLLHEDQCYVKTHNTEDWIEDFFRDLSAVQKKESNMYMAWGLGKSYRLIELEHEFQRLNFNKVSQAWKSTRKRVLFFDHEGTLALDKGHVTAVSGDENLYASGAAPNQFVQNCLKNLSLSDNIIIILSGRNRYLLNKWFEEIPKIGLCAEHGYHYRIPQLDGDDWKCACPVETDLTWKSTAMLLFRQYVRRTQGSFIENKGSALVFQYRDADPEFGEWQAQELSNYLQELLVEYPVIVVSGKGYVEVKLKGIDKGQAVKYILSQLNSKDPYNPIDFVICVGDDRSDEDMFPVVNNYKFNYKTKSKNIKEFSENDDSESSKMMNPTAHVFTVTVGKKPSQAKQYLNDVEDVCNLLDLLNSLVTNLKS